MYDIRKLEEIHRKNRLGQLLTEDEQLYLKAVIRYDSVGTYKNFAMTLFEGFDFQAFHMALMDRIDKFVNTEGDRLIITVAPQHGKTLLGCLGAIAYIFGRFPEVTLLYLTYNEPRAKATAAQFLEIISSPTYLALFPNARVRTTAENLDEMSSSKKRTHTQSTMQFRNVNSKRGKIIFSSLHAGIAGNPGDMIFIDDSVAKYEDAQSEAMRQTNYDGLYANVLSRIQKGSRVMLCNTHWHPDDLVGRLRANNKHNEEFGLRQWEIVNFPAIVTENNLANPLYDSRTEVWDGKIEHLKDSMLLWPKYGDKYLESMVQPHVFACMYQGKPRDFDGSLFARDMFKEYYEYPGDCHHIIISVDTNFKDGPSDGSKCGIAVFGLRGRRIYLLEFINKALTYTKTKTVMYDLIEKYPKYWALVVEQKANGYALIEDLRSSFTRIVAYDPKNLSKMQRVQAVLPMLEEGMFVPSKRLCFNIDVYIDQLLGFEGRKKEANDLVDATSQALMKYWAYFRSEGTNKIHTIKSECAKLFGSPDRMLRQIGYVNNGKKTKRY